MPPRAVLNLLIYTGICSKRISEFSWYHPSSVSPFSLQHSFPIVFLAWGNNGLQVYLYVHLITHYKCISKSARLPPASISLRSNNRNIPVHLWLHLSTCASLSSRLWRFLYTQICRYTNETTSQINILT